MDITKNGLELVTVVTSGRPCNNETHQLLLKRCANLKKDLTVKTLDFVPSDASIILDLLNHNDVVKFTKDGCSIDVYNNLTYRIDDLICRCVTKSEFASKINFHLQYKG